ncbi:MAG: glycosyltransferase family 2 protein [Bacteroidia bacterium]|nr:glycosyltransferase family 2 protein [Bacteroidia bacterium]
MTIYSGFSYLKRYRFVEKQILFPPSPRLGLVVVIPCHNEPELFRTLDSLEACAIPRAEVEVIVVINSPALCAPEIIRQNQQTLEEGRIRNGSPGRKFPCHFLNFPDLPPKHAGVGLARKIGMDEAVERLESAGNPNGIIICLDADSTVAPNYFVEIEKLFSDYPQTEAISIYFEHPLEGKEFPEDIYAGIIRYELFLRYYIRALRYAGYPYAQHAVGSSMAVRAVPYQQRGGMNRRKAGEDFYFLHKFLPENTVRELNTTTVYPSPRPSDKVPFGTGRAIRKWLEEGANEWNTYSPRIFDDLRIFTAAVPVFFRETPAHLPDSVVQFLLKEGFEDKLPEIRANVTGEKAFVKRFYQWFDGLKVLKYVHFASENYYPEMPVGIAAATLLKKVFDDSYEVSERKLLEVYRRWESMR